MRTSSIYYDIYSALQFGDVEYVRRLELDVLQNWQDTTDDFRSSALSTAAIYGSLSCCEEILKRCPSLLYKASKLGYTALHQAAFNGRQEVIKFLISASITREECRDIESGITTHDNTSNKLLTMVTKDNHLNQGTALHIALERGHLESAKLLIEASDPTNNLVRMVKTDGDTALHIVVKEHNLGIVKLLIEVDPDFEYCTNVMDQTPLFIAFQEALIGDATTVEIRKLLTEKQPNQCKVPIGGNNWTLLHHATHKGDLSTVEDIIKFCPECLQIVDIDNQNFLHIAVKFEKINVVKYILESLAIAEEILNGQDKNGNTPLHIAAIGENANIVSPFLYNSRVSKKIRNKQGLRAIDLVDENGYTAMHIAVKEHNLGIVRLLIEVDPDVEYCTNVMGQTPVFIAFEEGLTGDETSVEIRKLLIEKQPSQCKVSVGRGKNYWTLLHHAAYKEDLSTIEDIIKFCPECLEIVDIDNQNFLHIAVKFKHIDVVTYILESPTVTDEILNGQDNHGNTPMHIAAMGPNTRMTECFLYNSRVCKMIMNMQGLRPIDMIHFEYDKWKAGVYGLINRLGEKEIKDQTEYDLLVGALIATVSFAAGIAVPGGYTSDGPNKGTAVLAGKISFKVFVISNTIALLLSLYGVFSHFCLKYLHEKADVIFQLNMARYCSFGAIFAMVVAFTAGSYAVLVVTEEFSIIVSVLCCCFFGFAFYSLWRIIMQKNKPSFPRA